MITSFLVEVGRAVLLATAFFSPFWLIGWRMHRRRKRYRAYAADPFVDMPLRPPGESIRIRIEELGDQYQEALMFALALGSLAFAVTFVTPEKQMLTVAFIAVPFTLVVHVFTARKACRLQTELWNQRLGFMAERATAEELNQLLGQGFRVFHDVPFDGYNVDHVVVGPPGVYVVETKGRRKPTSIKGKAKATVDFDGVALHFPCFSETRPIEQARLNAKSVSEWLTRAVGEPISTNAILALPGWLVNRRGRFDVNVLNPREILQSFPSKPTSPLSPQSLQRISHQLSERCRLEKPKAA